MVGNQREIRSDGLANGKLERTADTRSQDTFQCSTGPMRAPPRQAPPSRGALRQRQARLHAVRFGAAGSDWPYPSGFNQSPAALPRRGGAGRPRPSGAGHVRRSPRFVPFSESAADGKTGAAIPRGESGYCNPRKSHTTTGASVRLTSVAHAHPYSPRERAERGYEPRRFSGPRKPAADGQCRRGRLRAAQSRATAAAAVGEG